MAQCVPACAPSCLFPLRFARVRTADRVIGCATSAGLEAALSLGTLRMATAERRPGPGVIHHSDQGVQYASEEYAGELKHHGFIISMSRTGNPYDNAMMESFFKTLKYEEVHLCEYETYQDVITRLPYFIMGVYNTKRLHSAADYLPPNEFEELLGAYPDKDLPSQILLTSSVQS